MKKEATTNQEENTLPRHPKFSNEKFEALPDHLKEHAGWVIDYQELQAEFAKQIGEYAQKLGEKLHKLYGFPTSVGAEQMSEHMGPLMEHFYPNILKMSGSAISKFFQLIETGVLHNIGAAVYAASSIETAVVKITELTPFTINEEGRVVGETSNVTAINSSSDGLEGVMINFGNNHAARLALKVRPEGMPGTLENPFVEETFKKLELDQLLGVAKEAASPNDMGDFMQMLEAMSKYGEASSEDVN